MAVNLFSLLGKVMPRRKAEALPRVTGFDLMAATQLATPQTPKAPNRALTLPSYMTSSKPNPSSALTLNDRQLANTDITTLRTGTSSRQVIADFVRASPDLSAAVTSYVRLGVTEHYTAIAYNPDRTCNPEATAALAHLITIMDVLPDYSNGFDDSQSLRGLSETWARQLMLTGALAGELVLDKMRLPSKIQAIQTAQIKFYPTADAKRKTPKQEVSGNTVDLDVPTFFYVSLDQDPNDAYSSSPIEPAIQATIFSADFMNDIRRIVKRAIHPRMVVTINEEKFRKSLPPDVQGDSQKVLAYQNQIIASLQDQINGLEPEQALVVFDTLGIDVKDHGNTNLANEYEVVQGLADSRLVAGAKTMPTVLGKSDGTSNVASTEAMMFVKYAHGTITAKLNEMFSSIFTLAVRLLGHDVYVEFKFGEINLKPEAELESFYSMRQSRVLELLSLGLLSDEEASIKLTGKLPPKGFKPLSGTGFFNAKAVPAGDGYNGASNNGSTLNQNMAPDTPTGKKGGQSKEKVK